MVQMLSYTVVRVEKSEGAPSLAFPQAAAGYQMVGFHNPSRFVSMCRMVITAVPWGFLRLGPTLR